MKRIILLIIFLTLIYPPIHLGAEEPTLKLVYLCSDLEGTKRWQAATEIISLPEKGEDYFKLTETGVGFYSGFKGKISWLSEMNFQSTSDYVKPLYMKKEISDLEGNLIAIQTQEFDYAGQEVVCTNHDILSDKKSQKRFKFKKEVINRLTLALYVQKFLKNGDTKRKTYMVTDEPQFYRMDIKVVDEEKINIEGKEVDTYKICIDPKLGIFDIVKLIIPKSYIWHKSEPDFAWLRFKGLESNPSSPQVEIISLEPKE